MLNAFWFIISIETTRITGNICIVISSQLIGVSSTHATRPIQCNLCESNDARLLFYGEDRLLGHPGRFPIVQCQKCGLVYQSPQVADLNQIYQGDYPSFYDVTGDTNLVTVTSKGKVHVSGRSGLYYEAFRQVIFTSAGRLLDIGCADGSFIAAMEQLGFSVYGVEPNAAAAKVANGRLAKSTSKDIPQIVNSLESDRFSPASMDIITMWHVIEHLPDPVSTLKQLCSILRPGGKLIIQTPRVNSPAARLFGPYWAGWESPRHLWLFTNETLKQLAEVSGFRLERQIQAASYGIFVLSVRFAVAAILGSEAGRNIFRFMSQSLPDRILYQLFKPWDALGLGSQLTLCFSKS